MNTRADLQLVNEAKKGRRGQEALLRRVYPKIAQIAYMVVGSNPSLVDDICQHAAMEVLRSMHRYRAEGSLEAWVGRIAYRCAVRHNRRALRDAGAVEEAAVPTASRHTPESQVARQQVIAALVDRLQAMPEERRVAFWLHQALGYSVQEVAHMLDTSPNTIKYRLKVAVREFWDVLDADPDLARDLAEVLR